MSVKRYVWTEYGMKEEISLSQFVKNLATIKRWVRAKDCERLEAENERLKSDLAECRADKEEIEAENVRIVAEGVELQAENERLKAEVDRLRDENKLLRTAVNKWFRRGEGE